MSAIGSKVDTTTSRVTVDRSESSRLRKNKCRNGEGFSPPWIRSISLAACPEGNNLVAGVMPNVSASQPWNPGPLTPVTGNPFFVHSEIVFVRGDAAATAKHDARHPPDFSVTGDVK